MRIKRRRFPASLRLLFLPHLHATSTGTTGSARIHCISPRLPHSLHPTSVDQNAVVFVLSLSFQIAESSHGGLVTSLSTFLELDGVDLLFDEPHLGGKDNLPLSVIPSVLATLYFRTKKASSERSFGPMLFAGEKWHR